MPVEHLVEDLLSFLSVIYRPFMFLFGMLNPGKINFGEHEYKSFCTQILNLCALTLLNNKRQGTQRSYMEEATKKNITVVNLTKRWP